MSEDGKSMPDIGKLVELIMKNPQIIEQISNLALADKDAQGTTGQASEASDEPMIAESTSSEAGAFSSESEGKKRTRLLYALKPYLSERRAKALDSVMTFSEIFDTMKSRK